MKRQKGIIILGFGLMILVLFLITYELLKEEDGVMSYIDFMATPLLITGLFLVMFGSKKEK